MAAAAKTAAVFFVSLCAARIRGRAHILQKGRRRGRPAFFIAKTPAQRYNNPVHTFPSGEAAPARVRGGKTTRAVYGGKYERLS